MNSFFSTILGVAILVGMNWLTGCGAREPVAQPSVAPVQKLAEPTWEEAVRAVREGDAVEIRLLQAPIADAQLADLKGLENLLRLNLPQTEITDAGVRVIAESAPRLELLRLGSPKITDAGLESISHMKNLRFLHLIDVPITDAGLEHLEKMAWLESFYLDGSQVTDEGLSKLLEALPMLHFHRDQHHLPGDPRRDDH